MNALTKEVFKKFLENQDILKAKFIETQHKLDLLTLAEIEGFKRNPRWNEYRITNSSTKPLEFEPLFLDKNKQQIIDFLFCQYDIPARRDVIVRQCKKRNWDTDNLL